MTRLVTLLLIVVGLTASCSRIQNGLGGLGVGKGSANRAQVEIEGTRFKARAQSEREDPRLISITVTPVAVNPDGAKEAGRYESTRYCLLTYGGSDIEWITGPDMDIADLPVADDTLTLQGRCTQR